MTDLERLVEAILRDFNHITAGDVQDQYSTATNVIDCVLSLNRRYNAFVRPRLDAFAQKNPDIVALQHLLDLIKSYPSPLDFGVTELSYRDSARMEVLVGVVQYLLEAQQDLAGETELERLNSWAHSSHPGDFASAGVHGFGLAGFQYLRMLFGAHTTKPDVHIIRYVSDAVGKKVNDVRALYLLERAAKQASLPILKLDEEIWKSRASR